MKIGSIVLSSPLRLAPMADITNAPFRLVARECGSSMVTGEEIEARAFQLGIESTLQKAHYLPEERPIAMQLLGNDPSILAESAKRLEDLGADMVDLNMGCPVPKITRKGQGAALMQDPVKVAEILKAMRRAIRIPLTVKIRGGWDEVHINATDVARLAESEGVDAITVHPRTRSQQFTGRAPWDIIADVVQAVNIPVTGNGDVRSHADARRMMEQTGCRSVMVGRGALGRPWIFDENFDRLTLSEQIRYRLRVIRRHRDLIHAHLHPYKVLFQLKKHLLWYASGFPHAPSLRRFIGAATDPIALWETFLDTWDRCNAPAETVPGSVTQGMFLNGAADGAERE